MSRKFSRLVCFLCCVVFATWTFGDGDVGCSDRQYDFCDKNFALCKQDGEDICLCHSKYISCLVDSRCQLSTGTLNDCLNANCSTDRCLAYGKFGADEDSFDRQQVLVLLVTIIGAYCTVIVALFYLFRFLDKKYMPNDSPPANDVGVAPPHWYGVKQFE
jgi:hypothetical protein